jgi:outer membrane protein assembly factor BamA
MVLLIVKPHTTIKYLLLIIFAAISVWASGQRNFSLDIRMADPGSSQQIKHKKFLKNKKAAQKEMQGVLEKLYQEGYITAGFDSIAWDSLSARAWLYAGNRYRWVELNVSRTDPLLLNAVGYKERYFLEKPVSLVDFIDLQRDILSYCENNGYPFAQIRVDSLEFSDSTLQADLVLEKGFMIRFDTIVVKGESKLKPGYLHNYLDIKPGKLYDESLVSKVSQKLGELAFASEIRPFEIGFTDEKAQLFLYLNKKKASQFDGIVGIAPNSVTSGKLLITGDVKLKLMNILNRGDILDINWRRLEAQTQDLKIRIVYPFLFSTPFGIDYRFWLLKQDTSFLTLNNNIGLQYHFASNNYLKAFFESVNSSLLGTDSLLNMTELPPYADINNSNYGLEYYLARLDYLFNPRQGIALNFSASYGRKTIKKNASLSEALYDSIELNNAVYKASANIDWFIPLFKRATILLATKNGYIESENLFQNELYRIGGLKTLRGFDEEAVFASFYSILNLEFRYLLDRDSFVSLFWNGAFYEQNISGEYVSDTPWGIGAGLSFRTGAGIFSVYYAMGKQFNNPFDLRAAKVHFGYTSVF